MATLFFYDKLDEIFYSKIWSKCKAVCRTAIKRNLYYKFEGEFPKKCEFAPTDDTFYVDILTNTLKQTH